MQDNTERKEIKAKRTTGEGDKQQPAGVVREGAVGASIWRRQSPSGYAYYDFSISRSWKSESSGKTGYSQNFFARNKQDLLTVIERVADEVAKLESLEQSKRPAEAVAA